MESYDLILGANRNWALVNAAWVVKDRRFTSVNLYWNAGWIKYNGVETRTEFHWGPARLGASYTLSKATSNTTAGFRGGSATNPFDLSIDIGPAGPTTATFHRFGLIRCLRGPALYQAGVKARSTGEGIPQSRRRFACESRRLRGQIIVRPSPVVQTRGVAFGGETV